MKIWTGLVLGVVFLGCDDTQFKGGGGGSVITGSDFCAVQAIFEDECTACHSGESPLGALDLEQDAYVNLIDVSSSSDATQTLVVPGDAENSLLYTMMAGTQPSGMSSMPLGGPVNEAHAEVVKSWIDSGADPCGCDDTGDSADSGDTQGGGE